MNKKLYISGSIGVTILKKDNKIVIVLADDHSNKIYCKNIIKNLDKGDHIEIKDLLKDETRLKNQVLLEEIPRKHNSNLDLEELWPDSPHTQDLKNLFLSNDKITGVDVRPYLVPFSWEILESESKYNDFLQMNFTLKDYLKNLFDFFNLEGLFYEKLFRPVYIQITIKNNGLGAHLKSLKKNFLKLGKKIGNKLSEPITYFFDNEVSILQDVSILCDDIMEFLIIMNIFINEKRSLIHTGLYHSDKILRYLKSLYGFEMIYENGLNNFLDIEKIKKDSKYPSCIYLPKE